MKVRNLKPFSLLVFALALICERTLIETYALKADVLHDQKIYCLQERPCSFQPGNVTDWGTEGLKKKKKRFGDRGGEGGGRGVVGGGGGP